MLGCDFESKEKPIEGGNGSAECKPLDVEILDCEGIDCPEIINNKGWTDIPYHCKYPQNSL